MGTPYIGEIRMFAGNYAPAGWSFCDGSLLAIQDNDALFSLIGTTYGGDGQTTFALPDLRGRVPIHMGSSGGSTTAMGEVGGTESVALVESQIPAHSHALRGSSAAANATGPSGRVVARTGKNLYRGGTASAAFAARSVSQVGGSQSHSNLQPFLCVNFIISLFGIFPSRA